METILKGENERIQTKKEGKKYELEVTLESTYMSTKSAKNEVYTIGNTGPVVFRTRENTLKTQSHNTYIGPKSAELKTHITLKSSYVYFLFSYDHCSHFHSL